MPSVDEPPSGASEGPSPATEPGATPELRRAPLVTAGILLAERGVFGIVWASETLEVTARYGRLVDFVDVGEPLTPQFLPLVGFEDDIKSLKGATGEILDLPGVSMIGRDGATPKVNISVHWSSEDASFLVVLARYSARSNIEVELSRQIRARLMAEAELSRKSKELARTNAGLARANRDLEQFAHIISHDLSAPMRALGYMLDELEAALAEQKSDDTEARLAEARNQSRRMAGMLSALLEYSIAGRKHEVEEEVDTRALARAVVQSLHPRPGFAIEIDGEWPRLVTLAAPLDLVLRNLVDNALKHHDRAEGRIRLTASDIGGMLVIDVADDGPGIAPSDHGSVFLPFRRLGSSGAEGQGMGLALVKRWVEAAGGRLELLSDATQARGATFRLHWPRTIERSD